MPIGTATTALLLLRMRAFGCRDGTRKQLPRLCDLEVVGAYRIKYAPQRRPFWAEEEELAPEALWLVAIFIILDPQSCQLVALPCRNSSSSTQNRGEGVH